MARDTTPPASPLARNCERVATCSRIQVFCGSSARQVKTGANRSIASPISLPDQPVSRSAGTRFFLPPDFRIEAARCGSDDPVDLGHEEAQVAEVRAGLRADQAAHPFQLGESRSPPKNSS